jgi:hypothetical protein
MSVKIEPEGRKDREGILPRCIFFFPIFPAFLFKLSA